VTYEAKQLPGTISDGDPYTWIGRVLTNFAVAEQAIGELCLKLGLSISNGSLTSIGVLRERLRQAGDRKCGALEKRISRWTANRPFRHLLAHATVTCLTAANGDPILVTRHLPLAADDVTPDRMWTAQEMQELLRQAANDARSIRDHVNGLLADPLNLAKLRSA
jgi:hypothetical protein